MTPPDKHKVMEQIVRNLEQVSDPEIPTVSVIHLGLIYDIEIQNETVTITHTLTSAFCPMADEISENIKQAGLKDTGLRHCIVNCTFSPPFSMDMVSEETKLIMGWM